jgi:O-acetylhomoserine/O-acetylserine sulfhydrylase-like pyridoxal-dependent enzyme
MISSYNSTIQTVESGSAYVFDTNRIVTGCTVGHDAGSTTFTLRNPGYYSVTFNTTFTTAETGVATVELRDGGVAIPGASGSETVTTAGDTKSVSFTTIVKVLPSCPAIDNTVALTLVSTGIDLTASISALSITKLC